MRDTNLAFLKIALRAERQEDEVLTRTFVNFGAVFQSISSLDHQIVFGRRGTGKTHLLTKLRQERRNQGEVAIQLDMRSLGSSGGLYSDFTIPLAQRATRLLLDVLAAIHAELLHQAVERDADVNLGVVGPLLDQLLDAQRSVKVVGSVTVETVTAAEAGKAADDSLGIRVSATPSLELGGKSGSTAKESLTTKRVESGQEVPRVNFGSVGTVLKRIVENLPKQRLWLLIDEWSEVPLDLQPFLADLLRRALLPTKGVTAKLAAIEQRTRLLIPEPSIGNVGLEIGADVSAAINLDDYMVFDNDESQAVSFFKQLVLKHVQAALEAEKRPYPNTTAELLSAGFTQSNAFDEVVRACEGVPRDAIHILSHAAQRAGAGTISVGDVRTAAQQWYQASKDAAVSAHGSAKNLLLWIVDKVIKERQTKAFLLEAGTRDQLIDFLYDERVLHLLRKGMSAKDAPGKRFNVYGIDYGCYVDLINTAKAPKGVLDLGDSSPDITAAVPKTDFRSIRRCVLSLEDFYAR
jgi:hypothetical protein